MLDSSASSYGAIASASPATARKHGSSGYTYERRRPELGTLYRLVRENLNTLYAATEQGFASPLPAFVRRELERYIDCGLLVRGFAALECDSCGQKQLVAFSCKGRGFCPSCLGRRMAQSALNLLDHVLPRVPLRQFVFTVPWELRARLAYDGKLFGAVGRIVVDSVLGFYRKRLAEDEGVVGRSGAVSVTQRVSSDLRLNPHLHILFLDGVFTEGADGDAPVFHPLDELETPELADLLQVIRVRVLRYLARKGVLESTDELVVLDDGFAEREPVLAQLAAAAVSGLTPAGPELRQGKTVLLRGHPGVEVSAPLSVMELGFSLHARTTAEADDTRAREQLIKYVLRPPLAQERLTLLPNDLVRLSLKRPFKDGTVAIDLDPLSLLVRLASAVPPSRTHQVKYAGVLGAASKLRARIVPPPPEPDERGAADESRPHSHAEKPDPPPTHRCRYRRWAELLRRTRTAARCRRVSRESSKSTAFRWRAV